MADFPVRHYGNDVGTADLVVLQQGKTPMRMVCLANSRKLMGRCIAGKRWEVGKAVGGWIRPVSQRESQEVSEYERQYEDGTDPKVLDIMEVPMLRPRPVGYQTENWLLDPNQYWRKVGGYPALDLAALIDPVESLWIDGFSTYHGKNDKIPVDACGDVCASLRLVSVSELVLKVFAPGEAFGNSKRRVQGSFRHAGRNYALWVTDPLYERRFLTKLDGTYRLGNCHLTISLGEQFQGSVFKLIAAVIGLDRP